MLKNRLEHVMAKRDLNPMSHHIKVVAINSFFLHLTSILVNMDLSKIVTCRHLVEEKQETVL